MRKLITSLLCTMLFCTVFSVAASAATTSATLKINYSAEGAFLPDVEVNIYRVADMDIYGNYYLEPPFSDYSVNLQSIKTQQGWDDLATTLLGYIDADSISPSIIALTNDYGQAIIKYLPRGVYLVAGLRIVNGYTIYDFEPFFVVLPSDKGDAYVKEANPKWSSYIPQTEHTVTKLWQDSNNSQNRPQQIEVEIYKDGQLHSTEILNSENSWKYTWQANADATIWTVAEKNVPAGYTVTVSENNGHFSIVNSFVPVDDPDDKDDKDKDKDKDKDIPAKDVHVPNTGDSYARYIYAILMCLSGLLLIILGIYRSRKQNEEN